MLKEAIKRRKPDFSESYYGFRAFGNLLEEAQARGLLEIGRDEKSGTYVQRSNGIVARLESAAEVVAEAMPSAAAEPPVESSPGEEAGEQPGARQKGQGRRKAAEKGVRRPREAKEVKQEASFAAEPNAPAEAGTEMAVFGEVEGPATPDSLPLVATSDSEAPAAEFKAVEVTQEARDGSELGGAAEVAESVATEEAADVKPAKKPVSRSRRPRKPKEAPEAV